MDRSKNADNETEIVFKSFFDEAPLSWQTINTSRDESDFRETLIVTTASGEKMVIKLADNDFTYPQKIKMWQRTVEEYLAVGYYCPKIYSDKDGRFPIIPYKGHNCTVYEEEFSAFTPIEDRAIEKGSKNSSLYDRCKSDIWRMTSIIASKHLDYTEYPSAYCLFDTFCPSDEVDEVLENALNWKQYAETLPDIFAEQVQRIWSLWTENRTQLKTVYHKLPTSVFQADLNPTNILVDKNDRFVGVFDFNLCGKEIFLNYLMRENFDADFDKEIAMICDMLKVSSEHYHFSNLEKESALMLYRCLKPLWYNKTERLKALKCDNEAVRSFLNKTEHFLTSYIDFKSYMG